MFVQFKQTLTKLFAAGNERATVARARGTLERLEDRMMLTASYGDIGYSHAGPVSHPYGDFGPPLASNSASYSSQPVQQPTVSYESYSFSSVPESGPAYYE